MNTPLSKLVHRDRFGLWLQANGILGKGVEIGTFYGVYANLLASQWGGSLYTVDPFNWNVTPKYVDGCRRDWEAKEPRELDPEAVYQAAVATLAPRVNCQVVRMTSLEAARHFDNGSLSFVFIDGDHRREAVEADLAAWWPKVMPGGVFAGHDFYNRDDELMHGGVFDAVWDWAKVQGRKPHVTQCTSWWFIK